MQARLSVRRAVSSLIAGALGVAIGAGEARGAEVCPVANMGPPEGERAELLARAKARAESRSFAESRALYGWLLRRNPLDDEARLGLARIDGWQGCWDLAEAEYREVLERHPGDVDVRAGLFDLLLWQGRLDDAERLLDAGLAREEAPPLLVRRARVAHWRGDETAAVASAERAAAMGPLDPADQAVRDRLYLGEARGSLRLDAFPAGYPNRYTTTLQGLQRFRKLEVGAGTQWITLGRTPTSEGFTDGRHVAFVSYHPGVGATAGLRLGFGAPARAVPRYEARLSLVAPLIPKFSGYFAYALWYYGSDKTVHIFAPALGFAPIDDLEIELRWWTSYVVLHTPAEAGALLVSDTAHTVGVHVSHRLTPRLDVGADYTYGVVLDQAQAIYQLFNLRSHVFAIFADWLYDRSFGVRPILGVERRRLEDHPAIFVYSIELGAYARW